MGNSINILNENYNIIDTVDYITIADSFVYRHNKLGTGNGEAKLYIGNESDKLFDFWGDMQSKIKCFFLKDDLIEFLNNTKEEYISPQQDYINSHNRKELLKNLEKELLAIDNSKLDFCVYRSKITPPRVYINSNSGYYTLMRKLGIPNMSYLSIMKLSHDNETVFYFKMFIDYKYDVKKEYMTTNDKEELDRINKSTNKSVKLRKTIIDARIGHGKYREKLLSECVFCPFTQVNDERLLIASHIKPWSKSNDKEKVDPKNGFIFTPTYDTLFDKGFITFTDDKRLIVSNWLSPLNQKRLRVYSDKKIDLLPVDNERKKYLKYHREFIFKK